MTDRLLAESPIAKMAWTLSGAICLLAIENMWIDPWIARRSHHRVPSLVAEALSGTWFMVLMAVAIGVILAVVCQVLLMRDSRLSMRKKALTAMVVFAALGLSAKWVVATGGTEIFARQQTAGKKHTVTLNWIASTTKGVKYKVYRGTEHGVHPEKLTPQPIEGLTFIDDKVESGKTYYYVTRAVDPFGNESADSNETMAHIP